MTTTFYLAMPGAINTTPADFAALAEQGYTTVVIVDRRLEAVKLRNPEGDSVSLPKGSVHWHIALPAEPTAKRHELQRQAESAIEMYLLDRDVDCLRAYPNTERFTVETHGHTTQGALDPSQQELLDTFTVDPPQQGTTVGLPPSRGMDADLEDEASDFLDDMSLYVATAPDPVAAIEQAEAAAQQRGTSLHPLTVPLLKFLRLHAGALARTQEVTLAGSMDLPAMASKMLAAAVTENRSLESVAATIQQAAGGRVENPYSLGAQAARLAYENDLHADKGRLDAAGEKLAQLLRGNSHEVPF